VDPCQIHCFSENLIALGIEPGTSGARTRKCDHHHRAGHNNNNNNLISGGCCFYSPEPHVLRVFVGCGRSSIKLVKVQGARCPFTPIIHIKALCQIKRTVRSPSLHYTEGSHVRREVTNQDSEIIQLRRFILVLATRAPPCDAGWSVCVCSLLEDRMRRGGNLGRGCYYSMSQNICTHTHFKHRYAVAALTPVVLRRSFA
jgi:hypothetical protein